MSREHDRPIKKLIREYDKTLEIDISHDISNEDYTSAFLAEACDIVDEYAAISFRSAFTKVMKEKNGIGCGCLRCMYSSVREVNDWISYFAKDEGTANAMQFHVINKNGTPVIMDMSELEEYRRQKLKSRGFKLFNNKKNNRDDRDLA